MPKNKKTAKTKGICVKCRKKKPMEEFHVNEKTKERSELCEFCFQNPYTNYNMFELLLDHKNTTVVDSPESE